MSSPHSLTIKIDDIRRALAGPLPGRTGQAKMAPQPPTGSSFNRWDEPDDCREAAVLLLLYPHSTSGQASGLHIALTRRTEYPGAHSGQISLPGGRREPGESLQQTALRETHEEIGVRPNTLEILGRLTPLYTPPSNFCIHPFVAYRPTRAAFQIEPQEVAELIETSLTLLVDPARYKEETWYFQKYGERIVPFFDVYGNKVWGATAMILSEFVTLLTESVGEGVRPTDEG